MKIIGILILIFGTYFWYKYPNHKHRMLISLIIAVVGVSAWGMGIHQANVKKQQAASSSRSESIANSKSESKEDQQEKLSSMRGKNIAKNINKKMAQDSNLSGFALEYDGSSFVFTVPSSVVSMSDEDRQSVFRSAANMVYNSDKLDDGTMIIFRDSNGNNLARTTITGGLKMYN